jgi:cytochrome c peroxidase
VQLVQTDEILHPRSARGVLPLLAATLLATALAAGLSACSEPSATPADAAPQDAAPQDADLGAYVWDLPMGFPQPQVPEDNPMTVDKVELGRHLFYDLRLSGNGTQACASCHLQELAFADGKATPLGSTGEAIPRNSPGLGNVAYYSTLTWPSPLLEHLEQQLLVPLFGERPIELGLTGNEEIVLDRLRTDPVYEPLFRAAFPDDADPYAFGNVVDALASFVRTMISGDSPYDRYVYQGAEDALSESAQRGLGLFFSERLECHHCHGGFLFSKAVKYEGSRFIEKSFANIGLYNLDSAGSYPAGAQGLFEFTADPLDKGKYRSPSLRNVTLTGPYMHDGSIATLEEVIRHYEAAGRVIESGPNAGDGRANPNKSNFIIGFTLTDQERADVIAFLESLTDPAFLIDPRFSNPWPQ